MSFLDDLEITEEPVKGPYFGIIYGPAGTGKTWLCKYAEKPFFVAVEKGVEKVPGVGKFLKDGEIYLPKTIDEFFQMLQKFVKTEHGYKTIVIDSGMFVDKLIIEQILSESPEVTKRNGETKVISSIADFDYGKGFARVVNVWELRFFTALKVLHKKGLNVILIAHSREKNSLDIDGNEYKKNTIDMCQFGTYSVPNVLSAKADWVLFMRSESQTKLKKNQFGSVRSVADNDTQPETIVYTRGTSSFDAKVRTTVASNVKDAYVIDIHNEATSKQIFIDLEK
jgi:hypothetical protein